MKDDQRCPRGCRCAECHERRARAEWARKPIDLPFLLPFLIDGEKPGTWRIPLRMTPLPKLTWKDVCIATNQQISDDIDRAVGLSLDPSSRTRITREQLKWAWKSIFPKGSRAGLPPEWTSDDLDFLRSLKIDPWK